MDAKSRALFINSVASGETIPCPRCGKSNRPDGRFCVSCGTELSAPTETQSKAPAFAPVKEEAGQRPHAGYVEPNNVFAQGLPDWSIEPPQVMVRRH